MQIEDEVLKVLDEVKISTIKESKAGDYKRKIFKDNDHIILSREFGTRGGDVKVESIVKEFDTEGNPTAVDLVVDNKLAATIYYDEGADSDFYSCINSIDIHNSVLFNLAFHLMMDASLTDQTIVYAQYHPRYKDLVGNPDFELEI